MKPQNMFEYKRRWMEMNPYSVTIHSDRAYDAAEWCKENINPWQWKEIAYTSMYEHTYAFEEEKAALKFADQFDLVYLPY